MRWLSPKTDENQTKQFLVPFVLIALIALIIAPLSVITSNVKTAPLKWIDELDWFEQDAPSSHSSTVIRIDGQSKLTNFSDEFTYRNTQMMTVTSPYMERLRNKTYDTYSRDGWDKSLANDASSETQYSISDLVAILEENNIPYSLYNMNV